MNLRTTLLKAHNKANCDKIARWIGNNQSRYDELIRLFLTDDYRVVQRAAWPMSIVADQYPGLVKKHLKQILAVVKRQGPPEAVKRNTVRILQNIDIPVKYQGDVMNLCFGYITDPREKPAVKAFSLTVLQNLSRIYSGIKPELRQVIETRWEYETPAFRSRARKILNEK